MTKLMSKYFTDFPASAEIALNCGQLLIRPPRSQDAEAISEALSDERVSRYLAALPCPLDDRSLSDYMDFLCGSGQVSRILELDGDFAGVVSHSTQLTFWVDYSFWRKGLASSAVEWVIVNHFRLSGAQPIFAEVQSSNEKSMNLLKKLGFRKSEQVKRRFSFVSERAESFLVFELNHSSFTGNERTE